MATALDVQLSPDGGTGSSRRRTPADDDDSVEMMARQILDDLELDLDQDDMYDLDLHWQSEPANDYGRMAVRRLSQELSGVGALTRRPSVDLPHAGPPSRFMALSRRQSDFGMLGACAGRRAQEWTRKSLESRRMSMDPTLFGRLSRMDRRPSDDVIWEANDVARRYSHGTIDELPEVGMLSSYYYTNF